MKLYHKHFFTILLALFTFFSYSNQQTKEALKITDENLLDVLTSNDLVFVNFYADWCRFSQMLKPIFNQAAEKVQQKYPQVGKVVLADVDCDKHTSIAQKYSVSKYPTMKLFRNGQMMKREYRGQRTVDALVAFIDEQMKDPITEFKSTEEMEELDRSKRTVVGYFESKESNEYRTFADLAKLLKDDCRFYAGIGEISRKERLTGDNVIFRPQGSDPEMVYLGSLQNFQLLRDWSTDKCVPLVREITFANGEELTEEGLPFLILFHKAEDTESLEQFKKVISRELITEKGKITFLHADCDKFTHPLHHLGKSTKDCPLIAIDSFKHMYLFKEFQDMHVKNKLKEFVGDLHSGKLHREFHHGPDVVVKTPQQQKIEIKIDNPNVKVNEVPVKTQEPSVETSPPESIFKDLKPSELRYTVVGRKRDEL